MFQANGTKTKMMLASARANVNFIIFFRKTTALCKNLLFVLTLRYTPIICGGAALDCCYQGRNRAFTTWHDTWCWIWNTSAVVLIKLMKYRKMKWKTNDSLINPTLLPRIVTTRPLRSPNIRHILSSSLWFRFGVKKQQVG